MTPRRMTVTQTVDERISISAPSEPLLQLDFSREGRLRPAQTRAEKASSIKDAIVRWLDQEL